MHACALRARATICGLAFASELDPGCDCGHDSPSLGLSDVRVAGWHVRGGKRRVEAPARRCGWQWYNGRPYPLFMCSPDGEP